MNTKTLNTYEKLWLANRASHNMALAGPTAFWLAPGHREARPLHTFVHHYTCTPIHLYTYTPVHHTFVHLYICARISTCTPI